MKYAGILTKAETYLMAPDFEELARVRVLLGPYLGSAGFIINLHGILSPDPPKKSHMLETTSVQQDTLLS